MTTKEIKITPPEGYEIDKENSTFECIKFKPVVKRWRDDENKLVYGWIITNSDSTTLELKGTYYNTPRNYNTFATEKQAKSALAMARISQIMANDERFGGVITDEEWVDRNVIKFAIERKNGHYDVGSYEKVYHFLAFHTPEQRELFLKENEDLVKDYLMID